MALTFCGARIMVGMGLLEAPVQPKHHRGIVHSIHGIFSTMAPIPLTGPYKVGRVFNNEVNVGTPKEELALGIAAAG